jgi:hypothetical protein
LINKQPEAVINVDASGKIATWGCYIGTADAPKPGIFPLLILIACDLAFNFYDVSSLTSEVLQKNDAPQKFNKYLGIKKSGCKIVTRASDINMTVFEYNVSRDEFASVKQKAMGLLTKNFRKMFIDFEGTEDRYCHA